MNKGFWKKLNKPAFVLAPMADVTDAAFRRIIAKYGKPDATWTEFVSADGLALAPEEGRKKLLKDLEYSEIERPIVAQFFTSRPENMRKAAELAVELGFDGIDINMGCPDRSVEKQGSGAALMRDSSRARELIRAAQDGASGLPVSIKTRIGYNAPVLDTWLPEVLKEEPAVVTIHARTRKQMSKVPAQWEFVKRAAEIRDECGSSALIFGNGDAEDLGDARRRVDEAGCDGAMLGRAIFGNPWLFSEKTPSLKEKLEVMVEHTRLFEELLGEYKNFNIMKKHYKAYVNGFEGAAELRARLMQAENAEEVAHITEEFVSQNL
jgi:nifR3 family TIM-barrel protein